MKQSGITGVSNGHNHPFTVSINLRKETVKGKAEKGTTVHTHTIEDKIDTKNPRVMIRTSVDNEHSHSVMLRLHNNGIHVKQSKDLKASLSKAGVPFEEV